MKSFLAAIMVFGMTSSAMGQSTVNDVPSNPNTMPAVNGANSNTITGARNGNPVTAAASRSKLSDPGAPPHKTVRRKHQSVVGPKGNSGSLMQ
jgi:hypothetical protein